MSVRGRQELQRCASIAGGHARCLPGGGARLMPAAGAHIVEKWSDECTHLVMGDIPTVTEKALWALVQLKPVVMVRLRARACSWLHSC